MEKVYAIVLPRNVVIGALAKFVVEEGITADVLDMERARWGGANHLMGFRVALVYPTRTIHCVNHLFTGHDVNPAFL